MKLYLLGLSEKIDADNAPADVLADLRFYYEFSDTGTTAPILLSAGMPLVQTTYGELGEAKSLRAKVAGQDPEGQHADWTTEFVGWPGASSPDALILKWMELIAEQADARASGTIPLGPSGAPIAAVYVDDQGRDYRQLLQKFLSVSISFSQAADDYLDDSIEGGGLLVENERDGDEPFTILEHHWDEAFGYFGAARSYKLADDEEIATTGYHDHDESGDIDLLSEFDFGISVNAAKRDRGSAATAPTDFSGQAIDAFLRGRKIIAAAGETLSDAERSELVAARNQAIEAWEKTLAATVIHYINEVSSDMAAFESDDYDYLGHAAHWSELKGFGLGFQFNPRSPVSKADFARFHELVGDRPLLPGATPDEKSAYEANLEEARAILAASFDFAPENVEAW